MVEFSSSKKKVRDHAQYTREQDKKRQWSKRCVDVNELVYTVQMRRKRQIFRCIKSWWEVCILLCFNEPFIMQIRRTKFCEVHEIPSPGHEPIWSTKSKEKRQRSSLSTLACVMHYAMHYASSSTISHYKARGPLNFSPAQGWGVGWAAPGWLHFGCDTTQPDLMLNSN